jgi:hypothetical protein
MNVPVFYSVSLVLCSSEIESLRAYPHNLAYNHVPHTSDNAIGERRKIQFQRNRGPEERRRKTVGVIVGKPYAAQRWIALPPAMFASVSISRASYLNTKPRQHSRNVPGSVSVNQRAGAQTFAAMANSLVSPNSRTSNSCSATPAADRASRNATTGASIASSVN